MRCVSVSLILPPGGGNCDLCSFKEVKVKLCLSQQREKCVSLLLRPGGFHIVPRSTVRLKRSQVF